MPDGVYDPVRPSGGNVYDGRVCRGLAAGGWLVREHQLPGAWPDGGPGGRALLRHTLEGLADGTLVLLDGLVCSNEPEIIVPQTGRLRIVVLLHVPLGVTGASTDVQVGERMVLSTVAAVVATSEWTRCWLLDTYHLSRAKVRVAVPGVDLREPTGGTNDGTVFLCVAAMTAAKGQDVLLDALVGVEDRDWQCALVGSVTRDAHYVEGLHDRARRYGIAGRVTFSGPATGAALDEAYDAADVMVLATRSESYGMVVTEALARGLPVIATSVGGVPEALGQLPDGSRPGLLVPPDDPVRLGDALRRWLEEVELRERLRRAALARRAMLPSWSVTVDRISGVLREAA
jgi:glycosyltransferase involved in cell wall biosynthesis